jgi:hypothetical protein
MKTRRQSQRPPENARHAVHNVEPLAPGGAAATLLGFLGRPDVAVRQVAGEWHACGRVRGAGVTLAAFPAEAARVLIALGRAAVAADGSGPLLVASDGSAPPAASLRGAPPLETLAKRVGDDGEPFLDAAHLEAGRRLGADFRLAGLQPGIGMGWSGMAGERAGGPRGLEPGERMVAARQRFNRALETVGPDLAGPLVDLCVFEHGIEAIEKARRWPVRSAKLVIRIGLAALARHYGLSARAEGKARAPTVAWRAGRTSATP